MFYYLLKDDVMAGYAVLRVSPNNLRGYIIDSADVDGECIDELLHYIVNARHFDVLSVHQYSVDSGLLRTASALRFRANGPMRGIERRVKGELPLLVRPVKDQTTDDDWHVRGRDIRHIDNWSIKGVCSDDA